MIAAGVGFRANATEDSLADAFDKATGGIDVDVIATASDTAEHDAFRTLASKTDAAVAAIDATLLQTQDTETASEISLIERGTGAVAEASALAAAGPGAVLLTPRVISADRMATCALAEGGGL